MNNLPDKRLGHLRDLIFVPDLSGTKYDIVRKVASGGMGTIFAVQDKQLNRIVALKILTLPDEDGEMAERMMREARIVAQLEHPNIVPIHDVGQLSDGRIYYVMKFVQGETLAEYRRRTTSVPELVRLFQRVVEALAFVHSHGIVHLDLKPTNIMVGAFGEVLIMDWGVALVTSAVEAGSSAEAHAGGEISTDTRGTADGIVLGTPAYMPPEQAAGRSDLADTRSDIYSAGAVLYFLLTGAHPYEGNTSQEIRNKVIAGTVAAPRSVNREISRRLEAICLRCMAVDPEERYQSASELASDITRYLDGETVSAYREKPWDSVGRWASNHSTILLIILGYLILRFLILFFVGT